MIYLREVEYKDSQILFNWANDLDVRRSSFNSNEISLESHIQWFEKKLKDNNSYIFIICNDKENDIGQIRLDIEKNKALISYSLDKNFRGLGIGKKVLTLMKEKFKDITLIGRVKYNNISSIKSFENAGFKRFNKDNYIEFVSK